MAVTINASTSTGLVQSADTSGEIELQSNGTTALKVNTNEGIQILNCLGVGNATPSTSGAGITFPATQSASSDANTLDDYEEGTWTPSIGGTATYFAANTFGRYTKIGRLVTVHWSVNIDIIGTGQIYGIINLPFTSTDKSQFGLVGNYGAINTNVYSIYTYTDPSTTNLYFGGSTSFTSSNAAPLPVMKNNAILYGTFTYQAA